MAVLPKIAQNQPPMAKNVVVRKSEVVSIRNLLSFVNHTLDCELRGLDDLKTGAVYCQLMHKLYPETIQIQKVRFFTSNRSDFEANFRFLNHSFEKLRVTRSLPMNELILGHNHVDFCNWMYKFFKANDIGREYDAKKARKGSQIGLCKSYELASFSTGSTNAMHKCQSMVFNYARNPARLERRNSLDIQVSRPGIFKNIQRKKQTNQPNPKSSQKKKISKTSQFLAESKNISLPSESEDELELSAQKRYLHNHIAKKLKNAKKVNGAPSNDPGIPKQYPQIHQLKCGNALCKSYEQETGELRSKLQDLQMDNEQLTKKLIYVERTLLKYATKPSIAVCKINKRLQQSPNMVEVHPRRTSIDKDTQKVEGSAIGQMPPRYSKEFQTCMEFSSPGSEDTDVTRHALYSSCNSQSDMSKKSFAVARPV
ncbi:uncharacterized protein LOC122624643 [Drosophila teissieri]|uniref:uncharacterized protein LOC122624643 n=1 Tax=Drosophila teissieri TaxID=7243 RepID=UPI001CBA3484|nr:uncharacterized protein LOC122624643 [Drosophila teissieri]